MIDPDNIKNARKKARIAVRDDAREHPVSGYMWDALDRLIAFERAEARFTEHAEWHCGKAQDECYDEREAELQRTIDEIMEAK